MNDVCRITAISHSHKSFCLLQSHRLHYQINLVQIITRDSFHLKLARARSPNWMKRQFLVKNVWHSHLAYAYLPHWDTMGMQTNWMRDIGSYFV